MKQYAAFTMTGRFNDVPTIQKIYTERTPEDVLKMMENDKKSGAIPQKSKLICLSEVLWHTYDKYPELFHEEEWL